MPLGPLRKTCVQPAPKSRLVVFGLFVQEHQDQKRVQSRSTAQSRSKASRLKPVPQSSSPPLSPIEVTGPVSDRSHAPRGNAAPDAPRPEMTRIQAWRGDAERHEMHAHAERRNDRLPRTVHKVGPASAGKLLICLRPLLIFIHKYSKRRQSRLGCRLNGGLAQWVEPHGCGESAQDMDVRSARAHGAGPE
jgi:hypothetical protein